MMNIPPLLILTGVGIALYLLRERFRGAEAAPPRIPNGENGVTPPNGGEPPEFYPEPPPGTFMPPQIFQVGDMVVFTTNPSIGGVVTHTGMEGREPNLVWRYTVRVTAPSWLVGNLYYPQEQDIYKVG